jgi:hypothetical protein
MEQFKDLADWVQKFWNENGELPEEVASWGLDKLEQLYDAIPEGMSDLRCEIVFLLAN